MEAALNKPKRLLTAYNFFFQDQRSKILSGELDDCSVEGDDAIQEDFSQGEPPEKETNQSDALGKVSFSRLGKTVGRRWRRLAPEDRVAFEEAAAADKERYKREMAMYTEEFKAVQNLMKKQKRTENRKKQKATKVSYSPKPDGFQVNRHEANFIQSTSTQDRNNAHSVRHKARKTDNGPKTKKKSKEKHYSVEIVQSNSTQDREEDIHSVTSRGLDSDYFKAQKTENSPKMSKSATESRADFIQCGSEDPEEIITNLVKSSVDGETTPYSDESDKTEDRLHYSRQHILPRPLLFEQTAPATRSYPTPLPFHFEVPYAVLSDRQGRQGSHFLVSSMPTPQVYHHPPPSYHVVLHPSFVNAPPQQRYHEDVAQQQRRAVYWVTHPASFLERRVPASLNQEI